MRLLIVPSDDRILQLQGFANALSRFQVETKIITEKEIYDSPPSRIARYRGTTQPKFKQLIMEFKPDLMFIDTPLARLAIMASKARIPVLLQLRGHVWFEIQWAKELYQRSMLDKIEFWFVKRSIRKCFSIAHRVFPICEYLANEVRTRVPNKEITVLYNGIDPSKWFKETGMQLKHPCVGMLQNANIYGKVNEVLNFKKVVEAMPEITFYWAGDGPYKDLILKELDYENFVWLGRLDPDSVRKYLSELDIFVHPSGIDMSPSVLLEAQLVQKAVLATNVGGISENMIDGITGYMIEREDTDAWISKIRALLQNPELAEKMGKAGRDFVIDNFSWEKITQKFVSLMNTLVTN